MRQLAQLGIFAVVADEGSLSKAAERLSISKSAVSRQISDLEDTLDIRLFYRSGRRTRLTDEGRTLLPLATEILQRLDEVRSLVDQLRGEPSGSLVLEIPDGIAEHIVLPQMARFREHYPLIELSLRLRLVSFEEVSEKLDVAIVVGELPDSSVICKRLGQLVVRPYASRAYLDKHGTPPTPADLKHHQCIVTDYKAAMKGNNWTFRNGQSVKQYNVEAAITVNNINTAKRLTLDGLGISMLQDFAVMPETASGSLVPLLEKYECPSLPIYLIYPEREHVSPKIRAVVEFLEDCFQEHGLKS